MTSAEFLAANSAQLESLGIPTALWKTVSQRISSGRLGSNSLFRCKGIQATTARTVTNCEDAVLVYPHDWVFVSRDQAEAHLKESNPLRLAVGSLLDRTILEANGHSSVEDIMAHLYRVAFQFEVRSASELQKLYVVSLDAVSPCQIPFSQTPLFGTGIFIDTLTNKSYTLLWPTTRSTIPNNTPVTRGMLTPMPDYSTTDYWKHHYATSNPETTFDWFFSWSPEFARTLKTVLPPGKAPVSGSNAFVTVLNVGSGNSSSVGDGLVKDGLADSVLHFDVSKEAMLAVKSKMGDTTVHEVQEFVAFDGSLTSGFPIRPRRIDWAFDKGTTDGLLRSGMEVVKRMWDNLAKQTDLVVWVSLGRPESRVGLIEDEIGGGWEVDQCLEIEAGEGRTFEHSVFVYVCRLKGE
ncbi:hypothetical protein HDU98_009638 [Podochytrium sp. JEL0797]|nr:hypothetical protein HDU98_009638 [Podochytrium sp. JEL0797]